jgi:hypothetical protein
MADRDSEKFASFLAPEAIFFNRQGALRGREAVVAGWRPFFDGPNAPLSGGPSRWRSSNPAPRPQ